MWVRLPPELMVRVPALFMVIDPVSHDPDDPPSQVTVAAKAFWGRMKRITNVRMMNDEKSARNDRMALFKFDKSLFIWYINFAG